jgi:uncharacterized damage-inducible protein DinB
MRIRLLAFAVVALPVALGAQQPAPVAGQPAPNAIVQTFLGFGVPYPNWLLAAFDSIPANKYDYKPTPPQQTIGYIAQHLEYANYGLCTRASGMKRTMTAKDSLADTVKARWPKDTLVARLRASLVFCGSAIRTLNDSQLADQMPIGAPGSGLTATRTRFLLLLVTDLAEHYSQIAGYMRLLGMVPPSALPRSTP